ncbi:Forkhead box protein M1 [Bagarius yarrelli]|uniref:Forkhead box protein M1 n=1 Tax=Bagarius yarrelli TaxID=175774 RepID=A0A556V8Q0_BAGYA|nr:Forkhead box protein M1 [Bagarius yarrelli]
MKESPRRPLILKRRKLPFQRNDAAETQSKSAPAPGSKSVPDGIRIMDHPTMVDTQVVVIPKTADLQSVIDVLTTKGKERGPQGPSKFILLSGSSGSEDGLEALRAATSECKNPLRPAAGPEGDAEAFLKDKPDGRVLEESLTNIKWQNTHHTHPAAVKKEDDIENLDGFNQLQESLHTEEEVTSARRTPLSERPPYSYMAIIQFAINSKKNKMMTLKEIYTWIEEHFPYFRNVAKPGWKNSIRHNLSLHDMFVREGTPDGKISYWTIKPEANRCLTLDQVYKPAVDPAASFHPQTMQVSNQQQQKRVTADPKKTFTTERKMKPLLPRTDSYLVPIQIPLTPSLFLSSPTATISLSTPQPSSTAPNHMSRAGCKRLCIASKAPKSDSSVVAMSTPGKEVKEERVCVLASDEPCSSKRKKMSSSRRKQRLVPPSNEEPVLLLAESTFFDSGLVSDVSAFQEVDPDPEPRRDLQLESEIFKTPVKNSHPASSTPSKALEPWRITPLGKGSRSVLDFSPIRTPQKHEHSGLSFSGTPFKDLPFFGSPRDLLSCSSRELQTTSGNRSLTEGLVLDTMNDSLSKILVDISFSGLEDDDLGMANLSWSQLIPELK